LKAAFQRLFRWPHFSLAIRACPTATPGLFAFHHCRNFPAIKDTMSTKIDFITYLKSTLTAASSKLQSALSPDIETAGRLDQIVRTAENISSGYWAKIEPLYEPFAPKLQLAVRHLNNDIIAGQSVPEIVCVRGRNRRPSGCPCRKPCPAWQSIENRTMIVHNEGSLQAHWLDGCRSNPVAANA